MPARQTLYSILDTSPTATFAELKKAYYRRAKACHPDLHAGSAAKAEEFKELVHAFNVLSDPLQRRHYDEQLAFATELGDSGVRGDDIGYVGPSGDSIMDSVADDILEELIVGNHVPIGVTLQSLMRGLESTSKFIRFREGKTRFYQRRYHEAFPLLRDAVTGSPGNILYRYYLGMTCRHLDMDNLARRHFQLCIDLGAARNPAQQLQRIRDAMRRRRKKYRGFLGSLVDAIRPLPPARPFKTTEQEMIDEVNRSMINIVRDHARQRREQQQRLLNEGEDRGKD